MVVMGGMRSFWGPLVGAAIYVVLQDYISSMTQNWMSFVGLLFVLVVMFFPRGILGMLKTKVRDMSMLEARRVTKKFGSLVAVNDISLSVAPGELRAIIGPNGAGKTTFFNLITGFFPPTSGEILLDGQDVTQMSGARSASRAAWRAPSRSPRSFPRLTVRENVRIAVEAADGYSLRIWTSRADNARRARRRSMRCWR